jgi:hypothetical protein
MMVVHDAIRTIAGAAAAALIALAGPAPAAAADVAPEPRSVVPAGLELPEARVRAWQTGASRPDRLQHFTIGLTTGSMVGLASREPIAAASSAAALGLLKELWDARGGRFDWLDLTMTCAGAAAAASTTITLTR